MAFLLIVWSLSLPAAAQELPLNHFQIRSSHNSYQRDDQPLLGANPVSITSQLDRHNVWWLEFDLRWNLILDDVGGFWIQHACVDASGNGPLRVFLAEVAESNRISSGLTFLYFDTGDDIVPTTDPLDPCFPWYGLLGARPADWEVLLDNMLLATFGTAVYTRAEFKADNQIWQSPQELLRRGKHIIAIVGSEIEDNAVSFMQYQQVVNHPNPLIVELPPNPTQFTRVYPTLACQVGNENVEPGLANGYNFASTNCTASFDEAVDPRIHPPLPTFVSPTGGQGRGTYLDPASLATAISRVVSFENTTGKQSNIEIVIDPATYDLTPGAAYTIDSAVTLTRDPTQPGVVTLE